MSAVQKSLKLGKLKTLPPWLPTLVSTLDRSASPGAPRASLG
ncbi:hypothetical protein [Prochlorothrix hollandica]